MQESRGILSASKCTIKSLAKRRILSSALTINRKDTLDAFAELKKKNGDLLEDCGLAADKYPHLSAIGPIVKLVMGENQRGVVHNFMTGMPKNA